MREALFSILGPVEGLRVLDLYAGSGALGIEALSRGAAEATFVDSDPPPLRAVRDNLERLGLGGAGFSVPTRCPSCAAPPATGTGGTWSCSTRHIDSRPALGQALGPLLVPVLDRRARIVCESSSNIHCGWTCR